MEFLYVWAFVFAYLMARQNWIFRKIKKIQDVSFEITKSHREIITEKEAVKMFEALNRAYWDWNKIARHFWIWDINKMRN